MERLETGKNKKEWKNDEEWKDGEKNGIYHSNKYID